MCSRSSLKYNNRWVCGASVSHKNRKWWLANPSPRVTSPAACCQKLDQHTHPARIKFQKTSMHSLCIKFEVCRLKLGTMQLKARATNHAACRKAASSSWAALLRLKWPVLRPSAQPHHAYVNQPSADMWLVLVVYQSAATSILSVLIAYDLHDYRKTPRNDWLTIIIACVSL